MGLVSAIAIFFIIWWVTFFAVLPFGDRSPDPEDKRVTGTEAGAPARPRLKRKVLVTTLASLVIFAAVYALLESGLTLDDIPLPDPPGLEAY
jgi:predicted secreted protein